jgi:glycosyltransferase involved in cell wall biosynthesis
VTSPTFSILLPTRDRLELLSQAIESVRRQTFTDWEVVVSDNASSADVAGYVAMLGDERVRCLESSELLPVTENWNRALKASTGRWIIMLGDDDGLLPSALDRFLDHIERHRPDAIYANAWVLTYPGVLPEQPAGSLRPYGGSALFERHALPYVLDTNAARRLVRASARFEMAFTFNMQHSVLSRPLIEKLTVDGEFFHSPYPDFYATNAVFWSAERLLVVPERLVVIGISPKSFGAYYFNRRERAGVSFLANQPRVTEIGDMAAIVLPGSSDRTSWLLAMAALRRNVAGPMLRIDRGRYRRLVLMSVFGGRQAQAMDADERERLMSRLTPFERFVIVPAVRLVAKVLRLVPSPVAAAIRVALHRRLVRTPILAPSSGPRFDSMLDVINRAGELPTT